MIGGAGEARNGGIATCRCILQKPGGRSRTHSCFVTPTTSRYACARLGLVRRHNMPDDPFLDVIQCVVEHLDRHKVSYAITGSVASGVHGEPVQSQDVDIALRMLPSQARTLAASLPERFYRSAERLEEVARKGGMANLMDSM